MTAFGHCVPSSFLGYVGVNEEGSIWHDLMTLVGVVHISRTLATLCNMCSAYVTTVSIHGDLLGSGTESAAAIGAVISAPVDAAVIPVMEKWVG